MKQYIEPYGQHYFVWTLYKERKPLVGVANFPSKMRIRTQPYGLNFVKDLDRGITPYTTERETMDDTEWKDFISKCEGWIEKNEEVASEDILGGIQGCLLMGNTVQTKTARNQAAGVIKGLLSPFPDSPFTTVALKAPWGKRRDDFKVGLFARMVDLITSDPNWRKLWVPHGKTGLDEYPEVADLAKALFGPFNKRFIKMSKSEETVDWIEVSDEEE